MVTSKTQLRRELMESGEDPFLLAAEAIDRSNRLYAQLEKLREECAHEKSPLNGGSFCGQS